MAENFAYQTPTGMVFAVHSETFFDSYRLVSRAEFIRLAALQLDKKDLDLLLKGVDEEFKSIGRGKKKETTPLSRTSEARRTGVSAKTTSGARKTK